MLMEICNEDHQIILACARSSIKVRLDAFDRLGFGNRQHYATG